jgi:transcription elongation factor GreA
MRVPIRKPGKFTGSKPDPYVTFEKYQELKNTLLRLKKISRPRAILETKAHASDGDFSDNAAYSIAKGKLRGINQRVIEIEDHLKRAVIIEGDKDTSKVSLGCTVTIETENGQKTYQILGSSETDPSSGILSHNSPIGSALLGHCIGETIIVHLAKKDIACKIISIK